MGFYGWGKTRVGEDCIESEDIVVRGGINPEAVSTGCGDDKGFNGELSRRGSGGGSRIGVSKGGGVFNGHGGD